MPSPGVLARGLGDRENWEVRGLLSSGSFEVVERPLDSARLETFQPWKCLQNCRFGRADATMCGFRWVSFQPICDNKTNQTAAIVEEDRVISMIV